MRRLGCFLFPPFPCPRPERRADSTITAEHVHEAVRKGGELFARVHEAREAAVDAAFLASAAGVAAELAHALSAGARTYPLDQYAQCIKALKARGGWHATARCC